MGSKKLHMPLDTHPDDLHNIDELALFEPLPPGWYNCNSEVDCQVEATDAGHNSSSIFSPLTETVPSDKPLTKENEIERLLDQLQHE